MEMTEEQIGTTIVLKLSGRFDAYVAPTIEKFFQRVSSNSKPHIIINLANVNFVDSTGLATLVIGMKHSRQQKGEMALCCVQQAVRIIFELTRLDKVFTICNTQEEALEKLQQQQEV